MLEYLLQVLTSSRLLQTFCVGLLVGMSVYFLTRRRYSLPPGPAAWPLVGNLLDFRHKNMYMVFHKWSQTYGPVMSVQLGTKRVVVLSRIDVVMEAMVKRQADLAGRPFSYLGDTVTRGSKDISAASYGPRWKLHRKLASKAIRHYLTGQSFGERLSQSMSISTRLMGRQTEAFDPYPFLTLTVFNILYGMCFGKLSSTTDDERFIHYIRNTDAYFKELGGGFLEDVLPPLRLCPTNKFRRACNAFAQLEDSVRQEVEEHRATYVSGTTRDLTDAILLAQKEAEKEEDPELLAQITDTHVVMTICDIFFAGIDTTRNTLHWAMLLMAIHPDVQRKVQVEVDSVIGSDLRLTLGDRERLPYTNAVLHETMRYKTVLPLGLPHEALCDTTVGGYDIPRGTMVMINHFSLHFDPDQWEEANTFRPERFLDTDGKMAPKPDSWLPFSAGRRVCLGETLARPEMLLILAGILRVFTISLAPGESRDCRAAGNALTYLPATYNVIVESRL